jgi:hypothetical protein
MHHKSWLFKNIAWLSNRWSMLPLTEVPLQELKITPLWPPYPCQLRRPLRRPPRPLKKDPSPLLGREEVSETWSKSTMALPVVGLQNPSDFCLKVKRSLGFFDIFWKGMLASLQNLGLFLQNELFETRLIQKVPIIKIRVCFLLKYFKIRCWKSKFGFFLNHAFIPF